VLYRFWLIANLLVLFSGKIKSVNKLA
jgi:hypothetical protein